MKRPQFTLAPVLATLACATLGLGAAPAHAQVSVQDAWVRATVPQQKATGAFMRINSTTAGRLVSASSPVAGVTELHEMAVQNGIMKMRQVKGIDIAAGQGAELKPGGHHIMLMNLKQQVREGDSVPVKLVIQDAAGKRQTIDVKATARPLTASADDAKGAAPAGGMSGMGGANGGHDAHKH